MVIVQSTTRWLTKNKVITYLKWLTHKYHVRSYIIKMMRINKKNLVKNKNTYMK